MRGQLSEKKQQEIDTTIPKIDKKLLIAASQSLKIDIHDLTKNSTLGIALVALQDAARRFTSTSLALYEGYACLAWYLEESDKAPEAAAAAHTGRFYADCAALLLYAAAEDVAAFIISFLDAENDFKSYLNDPNTQNLMETLKISSSAAKVGLYMKERHPNHQMTALILALNDDQAWKKIMRYRNTWTHSQPPIVDGLGIQYKRESRVIETEEGSFVPFGGGSQPEYSIDDLLESVLLAFKAFETLLLGLSEIVLTYRQVNGEEFDFDTGNISFSLF